MTLNRKKQAALLFGLSVLFSSIASAAPRQKAFDDAAATSMNQDVSVQVLANDLGRGLTIISVDSQTSSGGTVSISGDQSFVVYTPAADFTGTDVFSYTFANRRGRLHSANVTITVEGENSIETGVDDTNGTDSTDSSSTDSVAAEDTDWSDTDWPVAMADAVTTSVNTAVSIPVLSNDLGQSLELTEANNYTEQGGTASVNGPAISYQPPAGFTGEDTFWYAIVDPEGRSNSARVTVSVAESQSSNNESESSTNESNDDAGGLLHFDLIPMQNELMYGVNFQYSSSGEPESGGFAYFNIDSATAGSTELLYLGGEQGHSIDTLIPNQLITYIGTDGEYYTGSVASVYGDIIRLNQPLQADIARGLNLQNYYDDAAHPHSGGETAMADFALRTLNDPSLNSGKHLLLGDSWFASDTIADRLAERLPNAWIVNEGIGGNTSSDMLERFEADVAAQSPDVVWLIAGTNDYFAEVSKEEYVSNMNKLIEKIIALGARPIVFDSSLAPLMYGSEYLLDLSKSYASGLGSIQANQ